jgi:hypothetical protein
MENWYIRSRLRTDRAESTKTSTLHPSRARARDRITERVPHYRTLEHSSRAWPEEGRESRSPPSLNQSVLECGYIKAV